MNNYAPTIFACAPMIISFSYLIKKTYDENMKKKELLNKYNKFEDPNYNLFKDKDFLQPSHGIQD